MKDLGITISNDFSWHAHCFEIVKKANYVANVILHSLCDDVSIHVRAFDIYVLPILEYNCFIWNLILFYIVDLIEKVQKNCTREVFKKFNLPSMTYDCRLKYLKRHSLEYRRLILSICTFINIYYKVISSNILSQCYSPLL